MNIFAQFSRAMLFATYTLLTLLHLEFVATSSPKAFVVMSHARGIPLLYPHPVTYKINYPKIIRQKFEGAVHTMFPI